MSAPTNLKIAQEAGSWFYRLREDRSAGCHAEFAAWAQTSPQHIAEFLLISAADVELGSVDGAQELDVDALLRDTGANVVPLADGMKQPSARRRWASVATAAVVAGIALGAFWVLKLSGASIYETRVGEQRTVKLADDSLVQLNTRSRIDVRLSNEARIIRLLEGEALFTVARDTTRPFRVIAGSTIVEALGTQFNVYTHSAGATVSVVEGRVQIQTGSAPVVLAAEQEADIDANGHIVKSRAPAISKALAWRQRHLEFRSATVSEVAAEFNRYNRLQIRIDDEAVGRRRMSGVFAADEPQSLLDFLARGDGVRLEREGRLVVVREKSVK